MPGVEQSMCIFLPHAQRISGWAHQGIVTVTVNLEIVGVLFFIVCLHFYSLYLNICSFEELQKPPKTRKSVNSYYC